MKQIRSVLTLAASLLFATGFAVAQTTVPPTAAPAPTTTAAPTTAAPEHPTINQRRDNQQDRIGQGVKNGTLTPNETIKLERQQKSIDHQIAKDRLAHDGKLTAKEKKQINRRQNRASRHIYAVKHDGAHR